MIHLQLINLLTKPDPLNWIIKPSRPKHKHKPKLMIFKQSLVDKSSNNSSKFEEKAVK